MNARRRIRNELCAIEKCFEVNVLHDFKVDLTIPLSSESRYEGKFIKCRFIFPEEYPFQPPQIVFSKPIYHPNVTFNGILDPVMMLVSWSPALTLNAMAYMIQNLLLEPDIPYISNKGKEEDDGCRPANEKATESWYDLDLFLAEKLQFDEQFI